MSDSPFVSMSKSEVLMRRHPELTWLRAVLELNHRIKWRESFEGEGCFVDCTELTPLTMEALLRPLGDEDTFGWYDAKGVMLCWGRDSIEALPGTQRIVEETLDFLIDDVGFFKEARFLIVTERKREGIFVEIFEVPMPANDEDVIVSDSLRELCWEAKALVTEAFNKAVLNIS